MEQQLQATNDLNRLQGDIRLLEREKEKIQKDLEGLQTTKAQAFKEHSQNVQMHKEAIDRLTAEGKRLQMLCHIYTQSLEDLEKAMIDYGKEDIEKAKQETLTIYNDAEIVKKAAEDLKRNAEELEKAVIAREQVVNKRAIEVDKRAIENEHKEADLLKKEEIINMEEEKAKQSLAEKRQLLDDIDRQLNEKRMQVQRLDELIIKKTSIAETTNTQVEARLEQVSLREISVAGKERVLHDKNAELIKKELWLNDREATVGRAYREVLQRGGRVD